MATRKELKGVASGLCGSFISRNNDVGGYWGIGKLCLLAQRKDTHLVHLDLMAQSISPISKEFRELLAAYRAKLWKHLESLDLPRAWVTSATIELDFDPPYLTEKHTPIATWGNLFKLTASIRDDMGKTYTVKDYSYCWPHDPKREMKSTR